MVWNWSGSVGRDAYWVRVSDQAGAQVETVDGLDDGPGIPPSGPPAGPRRGRVDRDLTPSSLGDLAVITHQHFGHGLSTYHRATNAHQHLVRQTCGDIIDVPTPSSTT